MEYLQKYCKLDLGFTPIYEIVGTYIVSFLNTPSLPCHINNITSNHTLTQSNVILLAETKLKISDQTEIFYSRLFTYNQK